MTTRQLDDTGALDVAQLVRRAGEGDRWAWERLVDQYARLIWAITRDFKLVESDAADVAQVTWLRLLEHIHRIENPDRVGSWLAATARNECLRCLAARKKVVLAEHDIVLEGAAAPEPEVDERLLSAERSQTVREALSHLPWRWQRMLELLMADPPASYAEISDQLGLPVGSIGPTRSRCFARLRTLLPTSLVGDAGQQREPAVSPEQGRSRAPRHLPSGHPPLQPREKPPGPPAAGRPERGQQRTAGNRRAGPDSRPEYPYRAS